MKVAYVRISTAEQNEARQLEGLKNFGIERWYIDKLSGKNTNRPQLKEMLDYVREGDTIYIMELARLARSARDLLNIIDEIEKKGANLYCANPVIDLSTPTGRLLVTVIGATAEFERECIRERQLQGIEIAKAEGRYKGRPRAEIDPDELKELWELYLHRRTTKTKMARKLGVSRPTLDRELTKQHLVIPQSDDPDTSKGG